MALAALHSSIPFGVQCLSSQQQRQQLLLKSPTLGPVQLRAARIYHAPLMEEDSSWRTGAPRHSWLSARVFETQQQVL